MNRPVGLPRSLRARLTAGLVLLLALACTCVGIVTVLALEGFLVNRLDQQLAATGGRFAASLEHETRPDADNTPDTRGQADGTLGARTLKGRVTVAAVVHGTADRDIGLTTADRHTLLAVRPDGRPRTVRLASTGAYRVAAWPGDDADVLITGLPLHPVEETVHRLEAVESVVFGAVLLAAGVTGALWVRRSLRPLERLDRTAQQVTALPLATGQVAMPPPLPAGDADTEVGRLTHSFNQLLGHVGDALDRRHRGEERLRTFAADAGHELRTPVATVRAHAELAMRHAAPLPAEVRHALERIEAQSRRMSLLVDELLLLARLDAGRELRRETVDLTRIVLDATTDAATRHPGHRWELVLPEEPVEVIGDPERLQQAVTNLLSNAGRHTPEGTRVDIALSTEPGWTRLSVTDDGPGIPSDLLKRVFGRFTRGDTSRARATGSTGLGLAIVDAVARAHDGRADADSTAGGTCFTLVLPRADDHRGTTRP
ncbi:sensor histidine kinase [Streptomyces sp. NPDC090023]|uniref:sensor histidine kinase n=1 Tax=unclassified Streptomyces TaxID=2593676 RepID=UPI00381E4654